MSEEINHDRSAAAFDNPDHVSIVIHNYRWRLGLAKGEPQYDELEKRLAEGPVISVPTITLEGDANGAPHADATDTGHWLMEQRLTETKAALKKFFSDYSEA